jgi:hypothetical protein
MSMPLSAAEKKALIAAVLEQEPSDIPGYAVIGMLESGPIVLSNARDSAVIIRALAEVIESLARRLADGDDMQGRMQGEAQCE